MKTAETAYPKVYLYRRIVQSKLFIDNHFSEKIDLDNIADEAYFSKFHFTRLFKKIYGQSPHQYLTGIRIARAKEMLTTPVPVGDVCFAVGFESITSFAGLFKKKVGLSPSIYQDQQLQLKLEKQNAPLNFIPHCFAEAKGWTGIYS